MNMPEMSPSRSRSGSPSGRKSAPPQVRAAGGVVWRAVRRADGDGGPAAFEVVLVHRDRYDDWSLPKGKLDRGESYEQAAYRELEEETGLRLSAGLERWDTFPVKHDHKDTEDEFALFVVGADLTDADIVLGEGRQIVFVDPATVPDLPLTTAARVALPRFLASDDCRRLSKRQPG